MVPGTFGVALTVTDNDGQTGNASAVVTVGSDTDVRIKTIFREISMVPSDFTGLPQLRATSRLGITVSVEDSSGQVLPDHEVLLRIEANALAGGHMHNTPRSSIRYTVRRVHESRNLKSTDAPVAANCNTWPLKLAVSLK
jgi:hypothetical protein